MKKFLQLMLRSFRQLASRPLYWFGMIIMPALIIFFIVDEMKSGLPQQAPTGIVDKDHTALSRKVTRTLHGMQLVTITEESNSFEEAMRSVRSGKTYGFFLIPETMRPTCWPDAPPRSLSIPI